MMNQRRTFCVCVYICGGGEGGGSTDDEPEANILQGRWVSGSELQPKHDGAWGKKVSAAAA